MSDAFIKARRNLVLMSAFLLTYGTGAISFSENNAVIGFAIKIENIFLFNVWCGVFLGYFFWRFYTAGGGGQMIKTFQSSFEANLYRIILNWAQDDFERKKTIKAVTKPENFLTYGYIKRIPIIGYSRDGSNFLVRINSKKDIYLIGDGVWRYQPGFLQYWSLRLYCFGREVSGNNQFSELVLPWFLAISAAIALGYKLQTY